MKKQNAVATRENGVSSEVAEELAKRVFSGAYRPGEMLPKETSLVDELNVSRASVRSGLQTLASLGIIKRQVAQGTIVTDFSEWNILSPQVSSWMAGYANPNPDFLKHVFEFRYAIEPYISALAASRATARDLAAIEEAYEKMETAQREGTDAEFSDADIAFHEEIYKATHNLIWAQMAHVLRPAIMLVIDKSNTSADELSDSLKRHWRVMECIRFRRPGEAYDAAIRVLDRTAVDLGLSPSGADTELLALMKARALPEMQSATPALLPTTK